MNASTALKNQPEREPRNGFQWHSGLALGHPAMDAVHQEFAVMLNRLLLSDEQSLAQALDQFLEHARGHFGEEDRQMHETRYAGAPCHLDEHQAVLASGEEVRALLSAGRTEVVRSFAIELARWFPKHSAEMDQSLAHWLLNRRPDGRHPVKIITKPAR